MKGKKKRGKCGLLELLDFACLGTYSWVLSQSVQFVNIISRLSLNPPAPDAPCSPLATRLFDEYFFCCAVNSAVPFPGFRMRQRQVVVDPVGTLAGCPHLVESIPCEDARCHEWVVSEGSCVTDRGKCGPGHRVLKAVCKSRKGELGSALKGFFCLLK